MALATAKIVRDYGNLDPDLADDMLTPHLNAARRELKGWVGSVKYAEAEAAQDTDQIKIDLIEAEAYLAYYYAIDFIGLKHTPQGFTTQGQFGDGQFNYLGPKSLKELKDFAWNRAKKAAGEYIRSSKEKFHLGQAKAADEK